MKTTVTRLLIPHYEDRQRIIEGLANSGFAVWVVKQADPDPDYYGAKRHYVCFSKPPKRVEGDRDNG